MQAHAPGDAADGLAWISDTQGHTTIDCASGCCRHVVEKLSKKNKNATIKPFMVKNHVWIFVNCYIENPAFDSQVGRHLSPPVSTLRPNSTITIPPCSFHLMAYPVVCALAWCIALACSMDKPMCGL